MFARSVLPFTVLGIIFSVMPVAAKAAFLTPNAVAPADDVPAPMVVPVNDGAAALGADFLTQLALGGLFDALKDLENRAAAQEFAQDNINALLAAMGQVQNAEQAERMLDIAKGYLTPAQKRQLKSAQDGIESLLLRLNPSQKQAVFEGIAQALPEVLARHPELMHFAPSVIEEFGLDWGDVAKHLTPQMRKDIRGR